MSKFTNFLKMSGPSEKKVPAEKQDKVYKSLRFQTFVAGTIGYSLYYVCRTGLNVVKGPIIEEGFLTATQLGAISSCLLYAYAAGKFVNGVLADRSNIKRFMAMGLLVSAFANLVFGLTGLWNTAVGAASSGLVLFLSFLWTLNGWSQSMGTSPAVIGLSRWYPLSIRGTYYGFFSSSHNIGEGLSFVFCGLLVGLAGWQWGFFGSAIVVILYVSLIMRLMKMGERIKEPFGRVYCYAVAAMLLLHVCVNIGMTIGLMPVMGIPLPLMSYGGSSLVAFTLLIMIAIRLDASTVENDGYRGI